jgi:hypothetical protein
MVQVDRPLKALKTRQRVGQGIQQVMDCALLPGPHLAVDRVGSIKFPGSRVR